MPTRLESLQSRLQMYLEAEAAVLTGAQMYKIGTRELSRPTLFRIREQITYLEKEIEAQKSIDAGRGRNRMFGIIPRDI